MFYIGGTTRVVSLSLFPGTPPTPGKIVTGQMFVHYRIPEIAFGKMAAKYPIVLVHGGGLTGVTYETTPDGREGWATYFTRKGYSTYVVDFPGRGRAGFDVTTVQNNVSVGTLEAVWPLYRFGPRVGEMYPGSQFPAQGVQGLLTQNVPLTDLLMVGGPYKHAPAALSELLDRIGPAIVFVHSHSGPMADILVELNPTKVKAVVNVEGSQALVPTDAQVRAYRDVPVLEVFGDYLTQDEKAPTGKPRFEARTTVADRINKAGGKASVMHLPGIGIHGNSHMMMQDMNNLRVADEIASWIERSIN